MTNIAAFQRKSADSERLSVPGRGRVLSTVAETYGGPIRAAVQIIGGALDNETSSLPKAPAGSVAQDAGRVIYRTAAEMAAWHICAQWVLGIALGSISESTHLADALPWFDRDNRLLAAFHLIDPTIIREAEHNLRTVANPSALADLMPYVLDPHGPGSRLSVIRDPQTESTRAMRRTHGVFYTPADVAEYMVDAALANRNPDPQAVRVLDPACGTGVFLRAAFRRLAILGADPIQIFHKSLFGIDIDPWAIDGAAYVLVHDFLSTQSQLNDDPASLWKTIRGNLAVADALTIDASDVWIRPTLFSLPGPKTRLTVKYLFPAMGGLPNVIIGNPPYANVNNREDLRELPSVFKTFPASGSPSADVYPLFLEQMVRLAAPEASGAMVLPLSLAFSEGQQFLAAREMIERTPGTWRFTFFDREPHALFGEDVKTRNTIVTWNRTSTDPVSRKMTGPLLKWRGDNRAWMLRNIRHTVINTSIVDGIPKLNGSLQAESLARLVAQGARFADLVTSFHSTTLGETFEADQKSIFVGGTAYNFLNVFFRPPLHTQPNRGLISTNTVHGLSFSNSKDAYAAFALLSSGIAFWLWHTLGDGFHVSRGFLEDFPIGPTLFNEASIRQLSTVGRDLWRTLQSRPVTSINRGRSSISFPASRFRSQQRAIDELIVHYSGLSYAFVEELETFITSVVSAKPHNNTEPSAFEGELFA